MKDQVIEPSEIFVEGVNHKPKENLSHVNPWIRCIARYFDYALFFLLLLASRRLFHGHLPFGKYEHLVPFEFFVWIPIEALLLSTWGTTPGKFLLGTKLKSGKRVKLDYMGAMRRSFAVWLRGLGMGIIVLNFFCMLVAYNKLRLFGITTWDRDDHTVVTHHPIGRWRIYVAVFVAAAGILYYYLEKEKELQYATGRVVRSLYEYPLSAAAPA
ncbi:MAG TPA: RDD family protein [Chlamydiales bacterium]|nr:RDD family protein [Chlamydiales bacterium]